MPACNGEMDKLSVEEVVAKTVGEGERSSSVAKTGRAWRSGAGFVSGVVAPVASGVVAPPSLAPYVEVVGAVGRTAGSAPSNSSCSEVEPPKDEKFAKGPGKVTTTTNGGVFGR